MVPFTGVPFLIKDLGCEAVDFPTSMGSRLYRDYRYTVDSELFVRLQRTGLVTFGRTTSPEFGIGPTAKEPSYGRPTRNPWDVGTSRRRVVVGIGGCRRGRDRAHRPRQRRRWLGAHPGIVVRPVRAQAHPRPASRRSVIGRGLGRNGDRRLPHAQRARHRCPDRRDAWPRCWRAVLRAATARFLARSVASPPRRLRIAYSKLSFTGDPIHDDCSAAVAHTARPVRVSSGTTSSRQIRRSTSSGSCVPGRPSSPAARSSPCGRARPSSADRTSVRRPRRGDTGCGRAGADDLGIGVPRVRWHGARDRPPGGPPLHRRARCRHAADGDARRAAGQDRAVQARQRGLPRLPHWARTACCPTRRSPRWPTAPASRRCPFRCFWNDDGLPIGTHFMGRFGREALLLQLAGQLEEADPWFHRLPAAVSRDSAGAGSLGERHPPQRGQRGRRLLARRQLAKELRRRLGDGQHGSLERCIGRRRRLLHSADLAHVLTGGGLDLLRRGQRLEPSEGRDVSAHAPILSVRTESGSVGGRRVPIPKHVCAAAALTLGPRLPSRTPRRLRSEPAATCSRRRRRQRSAGTIIESATVRSTPLSKSPDDGSTRHCGPSTPH